MTQTIAQPTRPNGHPGYCACPECFQKYGKATSPRPAPSAWQPPTATGASEPTLSDVHALARRTHNWVVVIGWIVVIQATLALCFGVAAGLQMAKANHDRVHASAYAACIVAGNTPTFCATQN